MRHEKLEAMMPCGESLDWLATQPDAQSAWDACDRGDWMLWLLGRLSGEPGSAARKKLVLAACQCARLSLHLVPDDEHRPEQAICAAEQWALGAASVTLDDVHDAASSAAYAAYAADAAYAAYSAASAASTAYTTAATAYAASAASESTLLQCADIVRSMYPDVPVLP